MSTISVRVRVRPLRLAFLVRHGNRVDLRRAIQANTILWGGIYNAIVPVFNRTPRSWATSRPGKEIVRGYLNAFEPDFVVTAPGIDASAFGVPAAHAVTVDALFSASGLTERALDVIGVYRWFYERELRFVRRNPIHLRRPKDDDLLLATVFGEYPEDDGLSHFARGFIDMGGDTKEMDHDAYRDTLRHGVSPLDLGSQGLEQLGASGPPRAFILVDRHSPADLIDFWNLRALGWHIAAIPLDWSEACAPSVASTLSREHGANPGLPPFVTRAHFLHGRSVKPAQLMTFVRAVSAPTDAFIVDPLLPGVWEPSLRSADRVRRVELSAGTSSQEVSTEGEWFAFQTRGPEFVDDLYGLDRARFANVVELRSYDLPTLAGAIPADLSDLDGLLRWIGQPPGMLRNSSEGVGVLTDHGAARITWRVPHGERVFAEWLQPKGEMTLSSAGRLAHGLLARVGGPDRVQFVNQIDLVKLLDGASRSATRDLTHGELLGTLKKIHHNQGGSSGSAQRHLDVLVRRQVLRLGMRLQCDRCLQTNWFGLEELREAATCQWCLEPLPFPVSAPPKNPPWSYRPLGPFAARDFAQGSYTVAAAIHVFEGLGASSRITWTPSFTLASSQGPLEVDFALFWGGPGYRPTPPQLVMGECKTFKEFEQKDIRRMRVLARTFPRAILVFATLNATLSPRERALLAPLAKAGRKAWRSPVLVLTARELAAESGLPLCWAHGTTDRERDLYTSLTRSPGGAVSSLRRLADFTQQLHLGMPADPAWPHHEAP